MNKKVLMINGSFRKKNTFNLLTQIAELLKKNDTDSEIINLPDYEIGHCTGCDEVCVQLGNCSIDDGFRQIIGKISECDGLILGSPVYLNGVTSLMKTFTDRANPLFHKPEYAGLPVLCVSTTASTGLKETVRFLDQFITGLGARKGGSVTRTKTTIGKPVAEKEISRFVKLLNRDKKYYRPSMGEIVIFEVQKVMAAKSKGHDRKFWESRNWLDKYYYYNCKLGISKKLFSKMMYKILMKAVPEFG